MFISNYFELLLFIYIPFIFRSNKMCGSYKDSCSDKRSSSHYRITLVDVNRFRVINYENIALVYLCLKQ